MYLLSNLDDRKLAELRRFEDEKGVKVLAFSEVDAPAPANVDDGTLRELKNLEDRLGVTLIAYQ
jgi:hypothetical protein